MRNRFVHASVLLAAISAPAAYAQSTSSLTIYGRVNTTVESQKTGDQSRVNVLQNNASRWGLRGTEDLGGGLSAFFRLEQGFDSSTGVTANGFDRDAYMGLKGKFGQFRMGHITNITYLTSADWVSLHNHDTGTSSDTLYGFGVAFGARSNTVAYSTPVYNGFRGEFSYSFKEARPADARNATLEYNMGGWELSAGYSSSGNNKLGVLRALYSVGPFKVGGYYERDDFNGAKRNNARLMGMYAFGASELHLNVGRAGKRGDVADSGATQATIGYNYNLSKRTKLYAFYTMVDNDKAATYSAFGSVQPGQDQNSLAIGVRHAF
ncbi:porin [Diaphorobacter ruginosibacter]|uniref:Porin n=1 Tax=Diaphorobacter ruginosibacter TaxID=1715720 RepID=A0A7G9RPQ0_9BURK|nr:porin [Diaphorobacter ruginosibacter]QNN57575.1 porin [Diaphorobacter ruginosibacter]